MRPLGRRAGAGSEPGGWRHAPAAVAAALFVFPLVLMVTGSLRDTDLPPPRGPELLPSPLAFENYGLAFDLVDMPRYVANSLIVAALAVPLTVLVASWAGFAISRLPRRAAVAIVSLSLVALMVPVTALLVSRFAMFRTLRLTDTFVPLVAPALIGTSPFYVLLFAWAYRRLPTELFEASRVEGVSPFNAWRRVALPLTKPVTVAVAVLAFVVTWSDFLGPLIYLFDERRFTVPMGLRSLAALDRQDVPLLLAGAVVATAPVVVAFLAAERYFLRDRRGRGWLGP
jgi:multiple sugar transport system permease protein